MSADTDRLIAQARAELARADRLAEALRKIANTDPVTGRKIARAALAVVAPPETETSVESYETGEGMTDVEFYGR